MILALNFKRTQVLGVDLGSAYLSICLSVTLSFSLEFVVHLSLIYHGSAFFGGNSSGDVLCVLWLCVYAYTLWRRLVCYPPKAVPSRL